MQRKSIPGVVRLAHLLLVAVVLASVAPAGVSRGQDASSSDSHSAAPPLRDLWSPAESRFLRIWRMLGPVSGPLADDALASAGGEAAAVASDEPVRIGGSELRWITSVSWGDTVDVAGALGRPQYRGASSVPEAAYAYAAIPREREGDAILSLGSDGGVRIWVNGTAVHQSAGGPGFSFDAERIPVHLERGENRILLKLAHRSGPWRFALRVLEPGATAPRLDEIVPAIVSSGDGRLTVRTDAEGRSQGDPVQVQAIAPGGKVVAQSESRRGAVVTFETASWPDGAYEVRLVTRGPWDRQAAVHLPWYKGDAFAAGARLVRAAGSAPDGAAGGHLRMLADMVLDRAGGDLDALADDAWPLIHSPLMEYEELELARAGGAGPERPYGFVRIAYTADIDGSTQFCRAYLPADYDASRPWPLVVNLHGINPPNPPYVRWWSVDQRHEPMAGRHNVIWLEPHGRGNAQYIGIGEQDVLRCLGEARQRLSVDDDRVYLTGESMGGSGTWLIASRHPGLFAAAAPVFGGWDFRVVPAFGTNFSNPQANRVSERFAQEAQSSFASAEGLLNLPLLVLHGDQDQVVSVENSRHAVRMLQRWGYDVRYEEVPGFGHEDLGARDRIVEWLLQHRRSTAPHRVRIRALDLAGASAHWVTVRSFEAPLRPIEVDAEVIAPGSVRLDTRNVASVELSLPGSLKGDEDRLRVVWNGEERVRPAPAAGALLLTASAARDAALVKRPGLEGGLSRFITTPFVVVVGTASDDPGMRRLCREKGEIFAELWTMWQHVRPRVVPDSELTPEDARRYSLLLIGGADANLVTRRIAERLPLRVQKDSVIVDGRRFAASDAVVQMIYPSPLQPERYAVVVTATSAAGMHFWNPAAFWHPAFGFPTLGFDWTIQDGRRVSLEPGLSPERGWVAAGAFDRTWRLDDRWVFAGDRDLRASSPLRRVPPPGFSPAPDVLERYVGRYQLFPGVAASVQHESGRLTFSMPGAPPDRLIPETESEFGLRSSAASVVFEHDAEGSVTGLVVNYGGQEIEAARME